MYKNHLDMLPVCAADMKKLGWSELDILLVSGDAYIDHPSFACALLGRFLVSKGYRVGLVCQPRWDRTDDFLVMGRPRLAVGVSAGALDSMLAHYTAFRKKRHDDAFTPGGKAGARPNRAIIVYTNLVKQAFPGLPVIIGGIEASLRRYVHYDFWSDSLRRSILLDSKADALIYGMGEYALWQALKRIEESQERSCPVSFLGINGVCCMIKAEEAERFLEKAIIMPSYEEIEADSELLIKSALMAERHIQEGSRLCLQKIGNRYVAAAPPVHNLSQEEMDKIYDLPFTRKAHPSYKEAVPALEMIKNSINSHRGCGGGCSFCSLALHQGRRIVSRSERSILAELERIAADPNFKGSVSDVGGPTANMWQAVCGADPAKCKRVSCMFPKVCPNFKDQQNRYVALLRKVASHAKVKHVRIASGVRFDLALRNKEACRAYASEFTGGQLKIAPEHSCVKVLNYMRKPSTKLMDEFVDYFFKYSQEAKKEQYVIPYLMSAFPGCTEDDMRETARWLQARHWSPQQVQCFIPTPGTVASAMYYAEKDTEGHPIYVAKTDAERMKQHYLLLGCSGGRSGKIGADKAKSGRLDKKLSVEFIKERSQKGLDRRPPRDDGRPKMNNRSASSLQPFKGIKKKRRG
ncbi:MAG: YgiQ family radical SAM protein [Candidatus Bruticola sp.]